MRRINAKLQESKQEGHEWLYEELDPSIELIKVVYKELADVKRKWLTDPLPKELSKAEILLMVNLYLRISKHQIEYNLKIIRLIFGRSQKLQQV